MNPNEITTPSAAERYFDASVLGQLYTLMAEALGPTHKRAPARSAATRRPVSPGPAVPREGLLDRLDRVVLASGAKGPRGLSGAIARRVRARTANRGDGAGRHLALLLTGASTRGA